MDELIKQVNSESRWGIELQKCIDGTYVAMISPGTMMWPQRVEANSWEEAIAGLTNAVQKYNSNKEHSVVRI